MKDPRNYNPRIVPKYNSTVADPRSVRVVPNVGLVRRKRAATTVRDEQLTVDGQISKYGGIMSHADGKMHTSKTSYMNSLKNKGLVIRD